MDSINRGLNYRIKKLWPAMQGRATATTIASLLALAGCGNSDNDTPTSQVAPELATVTCDDSIKTAFKPDANTTVQIVKAFKVGDPLLLSGTATASTPKATKEICAVQLLVGPGNSGPAGAPSTSPGIGIQVWLPAKTAWNQRLHILGGGGWQGSYSTSSSDVFPLVTPWEVAQDEGAVSATTDTGHQDAASGGSFAMNPDGTINTALWKDFSERAIHEMAVKSKALAQAFYGSAAKYSYWDGASTGGRQGLKEAQVNPADFDGIAAGFPAINWTKFITAELYPQIVMQRDLGGTLLTSAQKALASNAAINACDVVGGQHLGYIMDPSQCRYDPTKDTNVLCNGVAGNGGVIGANGTASCVNLAQAQAINKMWYGMTSDGSVPDPAIDNGWSVTPSASQRWYGLARGANLELLAGAAPFTVATDMVALELQNPTIATPSFKNAAGNGADAWKTLSYAQLSNAFDAGVNLQPQFGNINTDNPDLTAFKNRGGKLITVYGLSDELIPPQGTINYYNRVATQMGGLAAVQSFYKFYLVPGMGHASPNGTANLTATPPLPGHGQIYRLLTDWVEKGIEPGRVQIQSPSTATVSISQPICPYPQKATYTSGDPRQAASYTCS